MLPRQQCIFYWNGAWPAHSLTKPYLTGLMISLQHLKERKVPQWSVAYLAAGWATLQVLEYLATTYNWSPVILRSAPIVLMGGLLITVVIAWFHGKGGRQRIPIVEVVAVLAIVAVAGVSSAVVGKSKGNPRAGQAELNSVVVLPFVDMSASRDQEYFGDGITEEILNVLASIPGLRVPGRTTSFSFKDKNLAIADIAQQLNVAHVLEGSVRKAGERVRITAQLIDARTDQHVWSETYDRDLSDVFMVQEEIARAIASALRLHIHSDSMLVARHTTSGRAHELYLKGLYYWHDRSELLLALEQFRAATREDPEYALAHAGVALAYAILPQYQTFDRDVAVREGKAAAQRALTLDAGVAEAHAALGQIAHELEWDWPSAEHHLKEAVRVDPKYATGHQWLGELYVVLGKFDEALVESNYALSLDPLSSVAHMVHAFGLDASGRHNEAIDVLQSIIRRDPGFRAAKANLIPILLRERRFDEARAVAKGDSVVQALIDGVADRRYQLRALKALENPAMRGRLTPIGIGYSYIHLGRADLALDLFERAVDARATQVSFMFTDPDTEPIRSDPRFIRMKQRVGL